MNLETAVKGMLNAEELLRSQQAIGSPVILSEQMVRLSAYTGATEEHLAALEEEYEAEYTRLMRVHLLDEEMKPTAAEARTKMELGSTKGRIAYLTRLVSSAWKQVSVIQSRINHLKVEAGTSI